MSEAHSSSRSFSTAIVQLGLPLITLLLVGCAWLAACSPLVAQEDAEKKSESPQATTTDPAPAPREASDTPIAPPNLPGRKLQNVKELLELLGVDASQWRNFYQDRPFDSGDEEYINRILIRMPRVGREWMHRHSRRDWQPQRVIDTPREFQGETLFLKGRAIKIEKIPLLKELLDRYDFDHHYRVTIAVAEPKITAVVCLTEIPFAWKETGEINEPVEIQGVFVKLSPQSTGEPWFYFVTDHIAWFPERLDSEHGISEEILALCQQGFDASTLHTIQAKGIGPLAEHENEAFYQMQAAVAKLPSDLPLLQQAPPVNIIECLAKPAEQHGKFVSVEGSVRRIERIEIESSDIRTRLGFDHYHVLYVFVPLHDERIKWARSANDPEPRIFDSFFPVTVCVPHLPAGMIAAPDTRIPVRAQGVMFKVWSYTPQGAGKDLVQPSPMLFAAHIEQIPAVVPSSHFSNLVFSFVLIGVLGLAWLIFSQTRRETATARPRDEKVTFEIEKNGEAS